MGLINNEQVDITTDSLVITMKDKMQFMLTNKSEHTRSLLSETRTLNNGQTLRLVQEEKFKSSMLAADLALKSQAPVIKELVQLLISTRPIGPIAE